MKPFEKTFKFAGRTVGRDAPVFVIAEAGSNHDGSLAKARKLIDAAAKAGADAVKFQSYTAEGLINPVQAPEAFEIFKKIATPAEWLPELAKHAKERGLVFLDTPFDEIQLEAMERAKAPAFKIASGDLTNLPFIELVAGRKKPVFLSVGCADMADVARGVDVIRATGNTRLVLMQCVANYPAEWETANVAVVDTLRAAFGCPVGYSDHSPGSLVPLLAVARGACAIEKHFTFDRFLPGPDHSFAMEVPEFTDMAKQIRAATRAMGSGEKVLLPSEEFIAPLARRGLYAARHISRGAVFTADMIAILRPARGLAPAALPQVIGRRARRNIARHEPLSWDCV
jgi:sialic acid synthase SpsE